MKTFVFMFALTLLTGANASLAEEIRPGVYRTPDERFEDLPEYDFKPHYREIADYRIHYLDEGPRDGEPILLLHGEPTWSYLYRKMIPILTEAGYRCIVPDLIGFGRSDKPASLEVHTYKFHVDAMTGLIENLDLTNATFFGQDWGGLIGLRVVAENEQRFARVVISNTGLPTGSDPLSPAFSNWKQTNQEMIDRGDIPTGMMLANIHSNPELTKAYDAPFPSPAYKAGPLIMPQRVPVTTSDPARGANLAAWRVFESWEKPFLLAFGDSDPVTRGWDKAFLERVPGTKGQPHVTIEGAGHFIQETHGLELATLINKFIKDTK